MESPAAIKGVSSLECNAGSPSKKVCCHLCMWGVYLVPSKACGEIPPAICGCGEIPVAIKGMTSSSYYQVWNVVILNVVITDCLICICFLPHGLGMRRVSTSDIRCPFFICLQSKEYCSVPQIRLPFCNLSLSTKRRGAGLNAGCDIFSRDYALLRSRNV